METESRLVIDGATAALTNVSGEAVIGVRVKKAAAAAGKTGFSISDGPSRSRRAALGPDNEKGALWTAGKADGEGKIVIRLDPRARDHGALGVPPGRLIPSPGGVGRRHLRRPSCPRGEPRSRRRVAPGRRVREESPDRGRRSVAPRLGAARGQGLGARPARRCGGRMYSRSLAGRCGQGRGEDRRPIFPTGFDKLETGRLHVAVFRPRRPSRRLARSPLICTWLSIHHFFGMPMSQLVAGKESISKRVMAIIKVRGGAAWGPPAGLFRGHLPDPSPPLMQGRRRD